MPIFKRTALIQVVLLFSIAMTGRAQNVPAQPLDLYILIGQSNMAGRGTITDDIAKEHDDRVYMFTKDKQWVIAKHPLHFDKPAVAGVGPGLTFGLIMERSAQHNNIGLVPCAVGGTSITRWVPGAYDQATKTHPYDDAVERITAAMKYGSIKGVLWLQGESDSSPEKARDYLARLTELIQRMRTIAGDQKLPFIVGELGRYRAVYANINAQLAQLPATIPYTAVASSEGLAHKGDTTHFDGPSAQEMGRRLAQQMLKVQGQVKK